MTQIPITEKKKGNRCGFDSQLLRQPTLYSGKNQASVLKLAKQRVTHFKINRRAEQREAILAVLQILPDYTDIWTSKLGMATKSGWLPFGWNIVKSRLPWLSESRFFSALSWLFDEGYLESNQRLAHPEFKTRDNAKPSGWAVSEKMLTKKFWTAVNLTTMLKQAAERKVQELTKKAAAIGKTIQDFYTTTLAKTKKKVVEQLAKAGQEKKDNQSKPDAGITPSSGPSVRAMELILTTKLNQLGIKNAFNTAARLIKEYGRAAMDNPEPYLQ